MDIRAVVNKCLRTDTSTYNAKTIRAAICNTQVTFGFNVPDELRIFAEEYNKNPDPFIKFDVLSRDNNVIPICYRIYYKTYTAWTCTLYYVISDNQYTVRIHSGLAPDFNVDFNQLTDFKTALLRFYELY